MKFKLRTILGAATLVAVALPMFASAHPSMYVIQARLPFPPEEQVITLTNATGGTFKPSAGADAVPFNAPAWMVQDALGADPAIGRVTTATPPAQPSFQVNVLVTGPDGGPYKLQFQGSLAQQNVDQVAPVNVDLEGSGAAVAAATTQPGGTGNITFASDPTGQSMPVQDQAVITNDGFVTMFSETNGLATNGWLNLKYLPGGYRAAMTGPEWLNYGPAQTSIQSHATCWNVPGLQTEANILASQSQAGNPSGVGDPFWNYVPWQKTSVSLNDIPARWIPVVFAATMVDLNALNTTAEFRAACEALNNGNGVYVPADNSANPASALTNQITTLTGQVAGLTGQVATLTTQNAALTQQVADLQNQVQTLTERPLKVTLQAKNSKGKVVVMVTGPLGDPARITLRLSAADAKKLKVSRTIAASTKQLGSGGATLVTLTPSKAALKALAKRGKPVNVTIQATSGPLKAAATGKLAR